jgi:acyl-CoA synthetase (AMP-forming)/AMP-acid ligase II
MMGPVTSDLFTFDTEEDIAKIFGGLQIPKIRPASSRVPKTAMGKVRKQDLRSLACEGKPHDDKR